MGVRALSLLLLGTTAALLYISSAYAPAATPAHRRAPNPIHDIQPTLTLTPPAAAATEATLANAAAAPSVATAATPRLVDCAPGCAANGGTCNRELGRCDCPPFLSGADCSQRLFPSCATQHGMSPPLDPCGIPVQPSFPATCGCLLECHSLALDARQECIVEVEAGRDMAASLERMKRRMPWMPMVANDSLLARTRADAEASISQKHCSGRGIYTVQLPYNFNPPNAPELHTPGCRCFPGYMGASCEIEYDQEAALHKCVHDCSAHGRCVRNSCRCDSGWWGVDCSINAEALERSYSKRGVDATPRPLIYVYEMPPRFTSWMSTYRKGDWTHDHWYGADVIMHHDLLQSPHRTLDPEQADYFFIPLYLSLGYYTHRYYFKHFTQTAAVALRAALKYVQETWPYMKRNGGRDHILVFTQDQGNRFVRSLVPQATPLIHVHHWGAPRTVLVDGTPMGDHLPGRDITTPPFHEGQRKMNRWFPGADGSAAPLRPETVRSVPANFSRVLFFSGKMNFNWGRHYSLGARQAVYRAHRHDPTALVMAFDNGVFEKLPMATHVANYATSKFCLAPAGYGFSSRQYECVFVGCVPVIIQDDVEMAFEEVLPWRRFAVRVNFSDIPVLPQILASIPAETVARMRRGLGCIWPRMLWLSPRLYHEQAPLVKALMQQGLPHDAFATTMWTLRRRLRLVADEETSWRTTDVDSCLAALGDDADIDLDRIRHEVRARPDGGMSDSARQMDEIIKEWARVPGQEADSIFAMKTRFFPSGERPPGFEGRWLP